MRVLIRFVPLVAGGFLAAGCQPARLDGPIIAEVMTGSEICTTLRDLSVPGGRLSGSANGARAEAYVADKLRAYGLSDVHFEPFAMTTWRDRRTQVTVLDDPPRRLDVAQALGNCLTTPAEGITAELADVGKGSQAEFEAVKEHLPGRFALAHYGDVHRSQKMEFALQHGAAGLLHISHLDDQVVVGTCHDKPNPAPGVAICKADGDRLAERLAAGETIRVNIRIEADCWEARPRNVVAEVPGAGRRADEVVLVCAHLDSWHLAEGAMDNGSGAVAILEAARALARVGPRPRRTIRFVWFMGEEHGLFGSEAYAQAHEDELDRIVAVINVDMAGEPRKFVTHGHPEMKSFLEALVRELPGYALEPDVASSVHTYSDHAAFMKRGVCALAIYGELGPGVRFYHTPGDKYDTVDRSGVNGHAALVAVLARRLADAEPMPAARMDAAALAIEHGW